MAIKPTYEELEQRVRELEEEAVARKRAEEALRIESDKLETITRNIGAGLCIISRDYRTLWANQILKQIFGEVEGKVCYETYNQLPDICPNCGVREVFETGKDIVKHEEVGKDAKGQTIWSEIIATPIRDKEGNIVSALELVVPITERKLAEEKLKRAHDGLERRVKERTIELEKTNKALQAEITDRKQAEEKLRASEIFLNTIVENIPDMIFVKDGEELRFVRFNKAGEDLLGYSREELIGKNDYDFFPKEEADFFTGKDREVLSTGTLLDIPEEPIQTKDKGERILHTKKMPILDEKGQPEYLLGISEDITERKRLEDQLGQAQKMESIGTLAGGIAHDFNNILFPMMGFAEMMLDDVPKDSPLRNNIKEIFQGTKRASDLVKQILAFSRQSDQQPKPLKVQLIIKEVLKLIRSSLPSTIEIKQHISNKCGLVLADHTQIHQVAMNLMTNAYHAMEDEGGKLEVTLKEIELGFDDLTDPSMTPGAYVCLTVADTGPGMDQSVISRIFEPYFTTKENGKGTGLGLAVVHGIVKSFNGDIKVCSEPGKGTAFHVYLPVIKSQVETEEADVAAPVPKGTERILLVDDEDPIVRMEKQMLERLGYDVTERTSSIEALEAFRVDPDKFDIVITDMTMPNMTGIQLSQKLLEIRPDIPIIICTGFSTKIDDEKAKVAGIRGYVMKPVLMSELAQKIREVLDKE